MSFITKAVGGLVGDLTGANAQADAAQNASQAQQQAAMAGIDEQRRQFDAVQKLLAPFVNAGTGAIGNYQGALGQLGNITGANGSTAQQGALDALKTNPLYTTAMDLGQQAILQNASATGGLRGGNTISSLGYLPNQVLTNVMGNQIGNLQSYLQSTGSLMGLGENAAAGTGNAGIQTGNNITNLLGQIGSSQAGASIAQGNAAASGMNALGGILGMSTGGSSIGSQLLGAAGSGISSAANFLMGLF
ncbi:hypothetical protein PIN31009_05540 [Pandoraea iniqua]|uniref:hypothetical protein n=1 Tax=Pandoraea iniqua TaxID=2508288 RepID=UPI00123FF4D2|nr:hypothetical protein [Pandoraea iniqua]VVE59457.1 hypothetical protein PIN31009_05540 [Pandoraea iniqua]